MMKSKLSLAGCVALALFSNISFASTELSSFPPVDKELRAKLPQSIRDSGTMTLVNTGAFPPYEMIGENGKLIGVAVELSDAIASMLGVKFKHETVASFPALLMGINSGRYHFGMGPVGDFPEREVSNDFVGWVQEYVVFAVNKGNPKGLKSLSEACGFKIAVMAGGSADKVVRQQVEVCKQENKPALQVQSYHDQPAAVLSVRAHRADAFFTSRAALTYYTNQSNGMLELAGTGSANGFNKLYQGAIVAKKSPLGPILLEAMQKLYDDGTYQRVMKKWGVEGNVLQSPGMNLAGAESQK